MADTQLENKELLHRQTTVVVSNTTGNNSSQESSNLNETQLVSSPNNSQNQSENVIQKTGKHVEKVGHQLQSITGMQEQSTKKEVAHNSMNSNNSQQSNSSSRNISSPLIKYGELVVLGYNGTLPSGDKGRRRSKFALFLRPESNGVRPARKHVVKDPKSSKSIQDKSQHSVSYTLSRNHAIIVEYEQDENTDMFQIGRSSESPIDFVVMDTVPGAQRAEDSIVTQSTISRFACRILVERNPPYTARIYAAGFDSAKNIFLGEKATKWHKDGEIDGLTTNGVLIMHPTGGFSAESKPGLWREISVGGGVYAMRESRSTPQKSCLITTEENILHDGTLVDLCGATLLWRSALGLLQSPSARELEHQIDNINAGRPQCPVGLNTLVLPRKNTLTTSEKQPYAYLSCGHVHGKHEWGIKEGAGEERTCPMCLETGPFVRVQTGNETSFYVDTEAPTYCFCPCGHMASDNTVRYWSSIPIPHGCHGFQAACPFCATPLDGDPGYIRLIFQDNVD